MIRNGRRTLAALLALLMVLVLLPTVSAQADSEIEIANYEQLKAFAARVNGGEKTLNAKLTEDITCTDKEWTPIGTEAYKYDGTFNGQGHTITGLSNADVDYSGLSAEDRVYIGLFGCVYTGKVQNVTVAGCDFSITSDAEHLTVHIGAIVGYNSSGTVVNCRNVGSLSTTLAISNDCIEYIGGGVGYNYKGTVVNCVNTGAVSGGINSGVGGVVGYNSGTVKTCLNTGSISGGRSSQVGGIVGLNTRDRTVEDCLNTGTVLGGDLANVGGVGGYNTYGTVKNCLSVGAVSGGINSGVGGAVGSCPDNASVTSYVENCYFLDTAASAAIGDVGSATVTNVRALSAEQLKSLSNCVGFSTDTWYEGLSYPVLKNLSGEVHLYANSNEDLVIASYLPAFVPTKIANPFTYADHDFTGWNTDPDGDGDPYSEDDAFTLQPGEALTLHAQWRDAVLEIASYADLKDFAARVNGGEYGLNAKITSDFTCPTATDWTPICPESAHGYTGTFNGNNCVITGLKFNQTITSDATQFQRWYIGLFGVIGTGGTVQDLYLKDCSIQVSVSAPYFNLYEGAVAGQNFGTITACGVFGEGEISGVRTGGDKSANAFVGGIAGYNNGIITDSCFIGTVNVQSNASCKGFSPAEIGGIAGRNPSGGNRTAIENCFHSGSVIASGGDFVQTSVGGIVGTNYAGLRNCRHNGSVQGVESKSHLFNSIGGVAGTNGVQGIITYCYARSAVEDLEGGSGLLYLGGVVGANTGGSTSDCFCDTTLAPDTEVIGFVGSGSFSDVVGLASEAFADESNFSGWENFDMNWVMGVDQPEVKALSAPVRLYANSNEDVVILNNIPVCTPVKFANPFTYEGHEFTGWNTQADGEGDPYDESHEFTLLRGETLSLSAQWRSTVVEYPLWVGGVQVTSANADDVLNDGGTVKFEVTDEGENVLTLDNANIMGVYSKDGRSSFIRTDQSELTILLVGENTLVSSDGVTDAIFNPNGSLTIGGEGSLSVSAIVAILAIKDITITGGKVIANSTSLLNHCVSAFQGKITVNGGKLIASCSADSRDYVGAICANTGIEIGEGMAVTAPVGGVPGVKYGAWFVLKDGEIAKTVVIEPAYTITFQNEDGTPLQSGPVAAGETPVYEGDTPTKAPTVEHLYTFAGWKLLGTETVLTELPAVDGEATYVAAYTESDRVYTGPVWAWDGYETATATFTATDDTTFTQVLTAEGDAITHMTTVEPDCEYPGIETYTAKVTFLGKDYFNDKTKEIAKRDHIWVFDEFVWTPNEQGIYTVVANFHCERYASHTLEFIPVAGMATDPETCTEDGCVHYVAFIGAEESPDGLEHEDKLDIVIPAHGHQWSAPDYERIETETGYDVYAIVRCYYDYSHRIEETVHATYEVITPPTLETEGLGRYTADFTDEHLWDIQWEVVIPKLALGLYGEDVDALDVVEHTGDGETLYRYDVMLRNDAEVLPIASVQMFIAYDDALTFVEAKTELHDAVIQDGNGVIALAWATDEGVMMENGTVVASLYFKLTGDVPNGGVLPFRFVEKNGNQSTVSYLADGTPVEAAAFETVDGSIVFAIPDAITIAGEDVLSGDIYTIEDGRILYRYNIRVRDLPEAGLWINSAQIFVSFDHAVLSVARTEGMLDWTTSESGDKLMAVWASDENVQISEGDVVLTVWFEKIGEAPEDGVVPITFTTNLMGNASAASITFCGAVAEIAADTVDGSITFEPILYGDANCDGEITAADAALILRTIVGLSELTPCGVLNADANGDLEITAEDAALILRYVVGLIGSLPA